MMDGQASTATQTIDPITLEIVRHGLVAIPNEIDANITRTAFSPLVYEYKDFATGIVDPEGRLIAQGSGSIPIFVANALGNAVRDGLAIYGADGIGPGDVIISNHAGTLGQHLNNVVMYTPVFADAEGRPELFGFMCVLVHWIDIGGGAVGSCSASDTTEIFQEGIQYRSVKLWKAGEKNEELYRIVEYNTRFPAMVLGDLDAQLAGTLAGRDKVTALLARYGLETVRAAIAAMWDQSEAVSRAAVRALPDGVYRAEAFLDGDGTEGGAPVPVAVEVRIEGERMTVDFSGLGRELRAPLNSGIYGGAYPAARIAFKILTAPDEPANEGCFRPLDIVIPDGTFLSAKATAPMGLYSATLPTVIDTIVRAVGGGAPRVAAGGHHASFSAHWFYGTDPATGELFQQLDTGHGGWGATASHDGGGPYKTMAHGDTLDVPVEVQETLCPLYIESVALRPDSAGDGAMRGGLGTEKVVQVLSDASVSVQIDRTKCPPWGIAGGNEGRVAEAYVEPARGGEPKKILKGTAHLKAGDRFRLRTGGGGGFGSPLKRPPARVAEDVAAGYVTAAHAASVYGVVLKADGTVDEAATASKRKAMG
jgi:N-methylhydantoinase B